jgi:polyphenol oxidase
MIDQRQVNAGFMDSTMPWENLVHMNPKVKFVRLKQVHGTKIHIIDEKNLGQFTSVTALEGDGLVTKLANVGLTVHTADCLPIVAVDFSAGVIGILHAGWKGLAQNAPIEFMKALLATGAHTRDLLFSVGPHIQECHFEVGKDVARQIRNTVSDAKLPSQKPHSDPNKEFMSLRDILVAQLATVSVKRTQIRVNNSCTYCDQKYFSFRRQKEGGNRNESFVCIKPPLV